MDRTPLSLAACVSIERPEEYLPPFLPVLLKTPPDHCSPPPFRHRTVLPTFSRPPQSGEPFLFPPPIFYETLQIPAAVQSLVSPMINETFPPKHRASLFEFHPLMLALLPFFHSC